MKNLRQGFTMIELIFVIVIIGILASVAIPKLVATRDDAKIASIIADTKIVFGDMTTFYTSQGSAVWYENNTTIDLATNVRLTSFDCTTNATGTPLLRSFFTICDGSAATSQPCIFIVDVSGGQSDSLEFYSVPSSEHCSAVAADPAIIALAGEPMMGKSHQLGGKMINRN